MSAGVCARAVHLVSGIKTISDNDGHEEEEEDAKMEEDNTLTEGGEEIEPAGDAKEDAEMMSQQDESPDVKPLEQANDEHAQGDPEVEESPPTKKKLEEGKSEKEREEEKKEEKSGDPVAGEDESPGKTEDSPEKKMKTGQTDAEGKQRKGEIVDVTASSESFRQPVARVYHSTINCCPGPVYLNGSTKSAEPNEGTGQGGDVPMDLQDGDKSEVKATKENTSTKDEMKAQDKSSPESESAPTDSSQPKEAQTQLAVGVIGEVGRWAATAGRAHMHCMVMGSRAKVFSLLVDTLQHTILLVPSTSHCTPAVIFLTGLDTPAMPIHDLEKIRERNY
ncbi:hypothetical protein E1301_Tti001265 [Triplophysa tibetana]|uniref:Uncharacterized protein n=1 Tax=Triplophysa tibetana TaxID=1572043 RepID=A0A5A9PAD9_9TELE|nr:hypothetical protein E1301_Tti001265 [Triplophysa tibetana]